jgi:hypothetical protein
MSPESKGRFRDEEKRESKNESIGANSRSLFTTGIEAGDDPAIVPGRP